VLPVEDEDARPLVDALGRMGVDARWLCWDDPGAQWDGYARVVVRSTWDYVPRRDEFVAWASGVPRIANAAAVLAWNTDKRYLVDLAAAGIPVVRTDWITPGAPFDPPAHEFVVKPSISVGANDTARYGTRVEDRAAARLHVRAIHDSGRSAMVQPYLDAVERVGESTLVFLGGRYSHCVRKGPMLTNIGTSEVPAHQDIRSRTARSEEIALASRVVDAVGGIVAEADPLLYARVDLLVDDGGVPKVLELEVTEPALFLGYDRGAVDRFAEAIVATL
jgi:hypothetical protein